MKVYLNDEKKSVDPRLYLKRVGQYWRNHCGNYLPLLNYFLNFLFTFFFEKVQSVTTIVDEDDSEKNEKEEETIESQTTAKQETEAPAHE